MSADWVSWESDTWQQAWPAFPTDSSTVSVSQCPSSVSQWWSSSVSQQWSSSVSSFQCPSWLGMAAHLLPLLLLLTGGAGALHLKVGTIQSLPFLRYSPMKTSYEAIKTLCHYNYTSLCQLLPTVSVLIP